MPVPNRGNQTAGLAAVANAVKQLEEALPMLAAEPEVGPQLMKAVESLRKLVPEGMVPKGIQDAAQQRFMQQERQQSPILAALKALGQGGGGPAGAGGAPPGIGGPGGSPMPPPPMPPTPLPG